MIFQLHWQNRANFKESRFVAQSPDFTSGDTVYEWAQKIADERSAEMPENWTPMICDHQCDLWVTQPPATS